MEPEENDEKDKEWMAAYNLTENQVQGIIYYLLIISINISLLGGDIGVPIVGHGASRWNATVVGCRVVAIPPKALLLSQPLSGMCLVSHIV